MNDDVKKAALWMKDELVDGLGTLSQKYAAMYIHYSFYDLTYLNRYGNIAISLKVLREFRKITKGYDVRWDGSKNEWQYYGDRF